MKAYWDSSALVSATADLSLRSRLKSERGVTRSHALAETFSALTGGNLAIRLDADDAARTVENLARDLDFVDLTAKEMLVALKRARKRGVRGGRVHDFMHAVAAKKAGVSRLLTADKHDFALLTDALEIDQI